MLPLEWYPQWWLEHPAYLYLAGPGRLLVPSLIHAAILGLELATLREFSRYSGVAGRNARVAIAWVIVFHALVVLFGLAALDMHVGYFYSPVLSSLIALLMAVRALYMRRQALAKVSQSVSC